MCAISVSGMDGPCAWPAAVKAPDGWTKQYGFDDGPCLTALREDRTVLVEDLKTSERWHRYWEAVTDDAVASILAVPIDAGPDAAAALNCYARSTAAFDAATITEAETYASSLSRVLRLALRVHRLATLPGRLAWGAAVQGGHRCSPQPGDGPDPRQPRGGRCGSPPNGTLQQTTAEADCNGHPQRYTASKAGKT